MKNQFIVSIFLLCFWMHGQHLLADVALEQMFRTPPESVQTACYWYWMNDHISEEGVVQDLQAMKKVGINRAFIGTNIRNRTNFSRDLTGQYFGQVKFFSDKWWRVLRTALKTAAELNIEIGIFNCPGWSQSGGPWVKPEQAMRYLEASEIRVKGPFKLSQQLAKPDTFFQDVKVLAIPVSADYERNLLDLPGVKLTPTKLKVQSTSGFVLVEKEAMLDIELPESTTVRNLTFRSSETMNMKVEFQLKTDQVYKSIKTFNVACSPTVENLATGFEPYAPVVIPFDELKGQSFRLKFYKLGEAESRIGNISMSSTPVIKNLPEKKLAKILGGMPAWGQAMWKAPEANVADANGADANVPQVWQVQDISECMTSDGILNWNVPAGEWIIMRTGMRFINVQNGPASFEAEGLETDKINKLHIESHFNAFIGQILERIPVEDRKTFKVVVLDSYERGGQNFTDGFLQDFKQRYGYDATPYLPVLKGHILGSLDQDERFLWDLRRLVADKISYDYVGGLTAISRKNGLTTWVENYGHSGFSGEFLQYGGQADEVSGEFWNRPVNDKYYENRGAASAAHTYGKNKIWAESFTSGSWEDYASFSSYPQKLKRVGDWAYSEGVNSTLLHVYIQQPYANDFPGIDAWFGTEFNRKNTWFSHLDLFTLYHKRCNLMLQQGLNVADVAYFIGEDAPKMTGILKPSLPKGYNFDFINAEVILRDLVVKDGKLVLPHGTSYRILVLPPQKTMRPEVLAKIEQLVSEGAVILGSPPSQSPSLQDFPNADLRVQTIAKKLWADPSAKQQTYGKGMVLNELSLEEAFKLLDVTPDCYSDNNAIRYTHRTDQGAEIFFLTNISDKAVDFSTDFRVNGVQPELWDALTGNVRDLPVFEQNQRSTKIPLHLEVNGSAFIVFRRLGHPTASKWVTNYPVQTILTTVTKPWKVTFENDSIKRGPLKPVVFSTLTDWTKNADDRIRYFSGTAVYKTTLNLGKVSKTRKLYLDLGDLSAMAKIKVNGLYVGGVWTTPYQVEVTGTLRKGKNTIEVELVNTWVNRLIGDLQLPQSQRIVQSKNNQWKANSPLQKSGLFGPVRLLTD